MARCWGITRNLHRCKRTGDWQFFCPEHQRQWIGWLFTSVSLIAAILGILSYFSPPLPVDVDAIVEKLKATHKGQLATLEQQYQQQIEDWKQQARDAVIALKNIHGQRDAPPGIDNALALLEQGDTKAAEAIFQEIANTKTAEGKAANQKAAEAYRHLGALAFLHDTQKALNAYRQATQLDPDNEQGWNQLGHLLQRTGQLKDAEAAYQRILALGGKRNDQSWIATAYTNLGVLYQTRGELGQAEATFQKGLAIFEALGHQAGMASSYGNLGNLHYTRGELERAEAMYQKALALFQEVGAEPQIKQVQERLEALQQAHSTHTPQGAHPARDTAR